MADAAVTFLLENLSKIISQKADLIIGVKDEAALLQDQLKLVQAYLRSFRPKQNESLVVIEYLEQFRRAAREGADIIDEYVSLVAAQKRRASLWSRIKSRFPHLFDRGRVAKDIKRVQEKFQMLYHRREEMGIHIFHQGDVERLEEDSSMRRKRVLVEDADVVGFDQDAKEIIQRLTEGDTQRDVVPIIGPAGIGKTTLAWKVYNDPDVISKFSFRAWVSVFHGYRVRDLLLSILKCAMGAGANDLKEMSEAELAMELKRYLRCTRYLIVLDDVWETKLWDELRNVLSNNMLKSRIILTTQLDEVARHVNPSSPAHKVNYLTPEYSQNLFFRRIFHGGTCPDELKSLGIEIVGKCGGLPLAIVVLAGVLLKKEKTVRWWKDTSTRVSSILTQGKDEGCSEMLTLSYDNLPHHLRSCFLYFSIFPRHLEISARKLVRFWIAEGFVHKSDFKNLEEVGDDYLEELVDRNLVQMSERRLDGSLKSCFIHELLQDLATTKAKEEQFLEILKVEDSSIPSNMRRMSFHTIINRSIFSNSSNSKLRSIICFDIDDRPLTVKEWKLLEKCFPLLRVLDLWDLGVESIPREIANLVHLRYLRLRSLTEKDLPETVCKLWNLQTLELTAPCIDRPQLNIWKMQELRHFYFQGQAVIPDPPNDPCELRNLLTLSSISPDCCKQSILSKWPNLLKLGIYGDLEQHMVSAFEHLSRLVSLQTLKLERDRRSNGLVCLPSAVQFPPNITKLTLSETQLLHDPMTVLGELPNLQILKLKEAAYSGVELGSGNYNGFPKLQVLKLINMAIQRWTVSEGSMLSLKSVLIKRCGRLGGLPLLLENMSTFVELELWSPPVPVENDARKIEEGRGKGNFKLVIR